MGNENENETTCPHSFYAYRRECGDVCRCGVAVCILCGDVDYMSRRFDYETAFDVDGEPALLAVEAAWHAKTAAAGSRSPRQLAAALKRRRERFSDVDVAAAVELVHVFATLAEALERRRLETAETE